MTRLRLVPVALGLVSGLLWVPTTRVAACDCAFTELPQAIAQADVAFVGTLVGAEPLPAAGAPSEEIALTWQLERSRDPIDAQVVTVEAWPDDGANCGVTFAADERWLVLGHLEEGRLATNGCVRNHRIDGTDPDSEATIEDLVAVPVAGDGAAAGESGFAVPMPILAVLAGVAVVVAIGAVAFRRER